MRTIEGYIARQIAQKSGLVLLVIVAALVLERTLRLMRDVDPGALHLDLATSILFCKLAEILGIAVPPAFFAGILLSLQRLTRDREMDVLQAAGAGPALFLRPIAGLTAAVAALLLVVFWFLQPLGHFEVRMLMNEAARAALSAPLRTGAFTEVDGKVLHIQPRADEADLFLYDVDAQGRAFVTTAVADGLMLSRSGSTLFMAAHDGQRVSIPPDQGKSTLLTVKSLRLVVHVARGPAAARGKYASELTFPELLDAPPRPPVDAQVHTRLARVLAVLLLPLAAFPLALVFPAARQWIAIAGGAAFVLALDMALIFAEFSAARGLAPAWMLVWGAFGGFLMVAGLLMAFRGSPMSQTRAQHT